MLKKGIYENIINQEIERDIYTAESQQMVCIREQMDDAESPKILADYLAKAIRQKLEDTENLHDRMTIVNKILSEYGLVDDIQIADTSNLLMEVMTQQKDLLQRSSRSETVRPQSGFRVSNLFTGGSSVLSLSEEIRREIASADEIYFIVSFLKLSGVRLLFDDLKKFCQREGTRLRIITTTYCGATETKAVQQLAELPHTEIHISYQTDIERLHAKAYIFVRNSGMHTAYIGSSNLSKSAQTDGLEWNMRVTSVENPHIIKTALATFSLYWNSPNFEDFRLGGIEKFQQELHRNTFKGKSDTFVYQRYSLLPHQKQILDKLKVEREECGNFRNLVVAATGTGKTVISAFDYQAFCQKQKGAGLTSRILFTAHREEILRQSLHTYRSVLQDANFGTLWVGNEAPQTEADYAHLFVSISMFNSRFEALFSQLPADYYDYIVIDEAHHSQADSYRKLFSHFHPQLLIGLTATPERMDGKDLRPDFGGRISAEIRLPQALQAGLLTPFQYLCVVDIFNEGVDIPEVDTVLFLRPTDSLTIFLQQLGRGLRLSPGKTELTVLDFVAQAHKKYDFASKFRALTLRPEKNIAQQITNGFTLLPTGCSIIMEKQARQYILENIQQAIYNKTRLVKEINSYTTLPTLTQFLENNGQDIRVVYVGNNCWTSLKRAAGRISYTDDAITRRLEKGMGNLVHHNTASYLHFVADFLLGSKRYLDEDHLPYATMLYYNLYQERIDKTELKEMGMYQALALLHDDRYRYFKQEAAEIVSYLLSHLEITTTPLGSDVLPCIELYGYYTREEIFTLVGRQTEEKRMSGSVSGVFNLPEYDATLLFVTLNKSDKDFSPSTQYDDYVINKDYFHWQSKNTDSHYNRGGKIYTEQPQRHNKIVLFVREEKKDGFGNTCPFHRFGLVDYVSSHGDFPMNITWKLEKPVMAQYLKVV